MGEVYIDSDGVMEEDELDDGNLGIEEDSEEDSEEEQWGFFLFIYKMDIIWKKIKIDDEYFRQVIEEINLKFF